MAPSLGHLQYLQRGVGEMWYLSSSSLFILPLYLFVFKIQKLLISRKTLQYLCSLSAW